MAKANVHGGEIGRIVLTAKIKLYCADGAILINEGFGWKRYGRAKVKPEEAYKAAADNQQRVLAERLALVAYRRKLHSLAGINRRWKLHAAIAAMPDDPDGVWSEVYDDGDLDDIVELCELYREMQRETHQKAKKLAPLSDRQRWALYGD